MAGAAPASPNPTGVALELCAQGVNCCIDLRCVEHVLPMMALRRIPEGPRYLAGLLNLHGRGVPVLDLGLRLGLDSPQAYGIDTPVVLCRLGALRVGLVVDEVLGVRDVRATEAQLRPEFERAGAPVIAVLVTEQGLSFLLDAPRLLAIDLAQLETEFSIADLLAEPSHDKV